jgi:hypothetical protein
MEEELEKLTRDDVDVDALEQRLQLIDPALSDGYYCYGYKG